MSAKPIANLEKEGVSKQICDKLADMRISTIKVWMAFNLFFYSQKNVQFW
jgi:hypothetical protein